MAVTNKEGSPLKTRAAVLYKMGLPTPYQESKPLVIEHLDLEPPGQGEVLVRIRAAGLCHSDLSVINGTRPRPPPMVLGTEAAREGVVVGEGVRDLAIGDHVVCSFIPSCGHCSPCREGRPALCEPGAEANNKGVLLGGQRRLKKGNEHIHHHLGCPGFAEYAVTNQHSLIKVDPSIPFHEVALFTKGSRGRPQQCQKREAASPLSGCGGLSALLGAAVTGAADCAVDTTEQLKLADPGADAHLQRQGPDVVDRCPTDGG